MIVRVPVIGAFNGSVPAPSQLCVQDQLERNGVAKMTIAAGSMGLTDPIGRTSCRHTTEALGLAVVEAESVPAPLPPIATGRPTSDSQWGD
jgi:hypothetical protein